MIVVADSSAIVALSICRGLPLAESLFGEIWVPEAVFAEVSVPGKPEAEVLRSWLRERVRSAPAVPLAKVEGLGRGEREAMALYLALSADLLVVDDARAKKAAYANGIEAMGSLGVLLLAKRRGKIERIRPFLELLAASEIHLADSVIQGVLALAGE
jgi:uncharacterized protein